MLDDENQWRPFRSRAIWLSAGLIIVAVIGLLLLYDRQPSPIPAVRVQEKGKLDPGLFGALATCLETLLAIGAISLLFEVLLRETYARTLRRFLRLRTALVRSGLQDIGSNPQLEWPSIVEPASRITALVRDPSQWLIPHLSCVITACQKRAADVLIGLPDPDGARLEQIAATVGLDRQTLQLNITTAVDTIRNQWQSQRAHLHNGAKIRIVAYDEIPLHELLVGDDSVILLQARAINHQTGAWQLAMVFDQDDKQYPAGFLRGAVSDLAQKNELWAGDV